MLTGDGVVSWYVPSAKGIARFPLEIGDYALRERTTDTHHGYPSQQYARTVLRPPQGQTDTPK